MLPRTQSTRTGLASGSIACGEKSGVGGRLILEGHRSGMEDGLGDGKQVAGGRRGERCPVPSRTTSDVTPHIVCWRAL